MQQGNDCTRRFCSSGPCSTTPFRHRLTNIGHPSCETLRNDRESLLWTSATFGPANDPTCLNRKASM